MTIGSNGPEDERLTPLDNDYPGNMCFFCGQANPVGLRLRFLRTADDPPEVVCRHTPDRRHSGLGSLLHGGISSGMLDEIMGWTAHGVLRRAAVTAELRVEFLGPLYVGRPLEARCRVAGVEGRRVLLEASITDHQGLVAVRGTGVYVQISPERFAAVTGGQG